MTNRADVATLDEDVIMLHINVREGTCRRVQFAFASVQHPGPSTASLSPGQAKQSDRGQHCVVLNRMRPRTVPV